MAANRPDRDSHEWTIEWYDIAIDGDDFAHIEAGTVEDALARAEDFFVERKLKHPNSDIPARATVSPRVTCHEVEMERVRARCDEMARESEAKATERRERAEFERLRAKFGG